RQAGPDHAGAVLPRRHAEDAGDSAASAAGRVAVTAPYVLVKRAGREACAAHTGGVRLAGRVVDDEAVEPEPVTVGGAVVARGNEERHARDRQELQLLVGCG